MDENKLRALKKTVEALVTSGSATLDEKRLKSLKSICKLSDSYVCELFKVVLKYLKRNHAEIRFSAFQICDEIFNRSHCFREMLIKELNLICSLVITFKFNKNDLKPVAVAKKLREISIKSIKSWYEKYKSGYPALAIAFKYLKECENVDFEELSISTTQERHAREVQRQKDADIMSRKVNKVLNEINEKSDEITNSITEFNNAFKLLVPDLENFFIPVETDLDTDSSGAGNPSVECDSGIDTFEYGSDTMREHGIIKETNVEINLANIHSIYENSDNEILVSALREKFLNISKNLIPKVKEWEQSVIQYSSTHSELIRSIIDIKRKLDSVVSCYCSLKIISKSKESTINNQNSNIPSSINSSDDEDDDFIDVPMDNAKVASAHAMEAELLRESGISFEKHAKNYLITKADLDAAGSSGSIHKNSFSEKKIKRDLSIESFIDEKWENPLKFTNNFTGLSNIWSANETLHDDLEGLKPNETLGIATRAVNIQSEFVPVNWECRAPLPTGRLCPRKDREACPLHGPVVPRDETGKPVKTEDHLKEQKRLEQLERDNPDWQNPALLAEIKATTGVDLSIKKAKKRKRKYPNLTDLKTIDSSPRKRLEKRIFNKNSMRKLNKALAKLPR